MNDYLREIAGEDFTAKDFRTWAGTVLAALALQEFEAFDSETQAQEEHRRGDRAGRRAAGQHRRGLPQVLRPPGGDRRLPRRLAGYWEQRARARAQTAQELHTLRPEEAAVLATLERLAARQREAA